MLQLHNNTPFVAEKIWFPNEDAIDTLYIMVKATFNINSKLTLTDQQRPISAVDQYWTEPGKSSIKYASDHHIGKSCSDIIMLGHAFAPMKQETRQLDVSLSVGKVNKTVRVFGDRQWQDGHITNPLAFKTMAMVYEKAFGGQYVRDGQIIDAEKRNPVGRGFSGNRSSIEMNGVPLPNLEDPKDLITHHKQQPMPACFGVSAPHWLPRSSFAGTYDAAWETQRAPYLPEDFDKRYFNTAHPDLIYPVYLEGGEPVEITNMHSKGNIKFSVPNVNVYADVIIANKSVKPFFNMETLIINPNQLLFSMVWRASVLCDKSVLKISDVKVSLQK